MTPLKSEEPEKKTFVQARCRCHPTLPPVPGQPMRIEHEYHRRGALAYLAALDVHHARVLGRCEDTTGIVPFSRLVEQVMTTEPYAWARRVFFIADNGSSHRGQSSINRMANAWPIAQLVHLPLHASWLNQIEIDFSIIQRKVLVPNDFHDLDTIVDRLLAFQTYWQDRHPVRLEVHPHRPQRPPRLHRHPRTPRDRSLNRYVTALTYQTT